MKGKLEWFKWFPKDAETDEIYASMTHEELGFYHRCLNRAWINNGLPADAEARARLLRTPRAEADRLWVVVGRCFFLEGDRVVNPRQEQERSEAKAKSESATKSVRTRYERRENVPLRASGSVSGSPSSSVVEETTPEVSLAETGLSPLDVLSEIEPIYFASGCPIPEKHKQLSLQLMLDIPASRRYRLTNYVKHAFMSGKWPNPSKTKSLLNVLRDGDWDVEITPRTLPDPIRPREPTRSEQTTSEATRRVLEREARRAARNSRT